MTKKTNSPIKKNQVAGSPSESDFSYLLFSILLIGGTALFLVPTLLERYVSSRFTLASVVLLWGGMVMFLRPKVPRSSAFHLMDALFLAYYLTHVVSIVQAHNIAEAIFTIQKVGLSFWAYFIFRHIFKWFPDMRSGILYITAVLTALLQLLIAGQILYYIGEQGFKNEALYAVSGAMGNKSLASEYLFMLLPFNVMAALETKKPSFPRIATVLSLISILLMVLLQVRTVYLALAVFFLLFIILQRKNISRRLVWPWKKLALMAGGMVIALLVVLKLTGSLEPFLERINPANFKESSSAAERRFVWFKTRQIITDHPWSGVGAGNWKVIFPSKGLDGAYRMQEENIVFTRTHNDYLEIWAETGLPGLLSYIALLVLGAGVCIYFLLKKDAASSEEMTLLLAAILGYSIICFFDFPKERIEHQILLSLMLGWIAWRGESLLSGWSISISSGVQKGIALLFSGLMLFNVIAGYYRMKGDYHAYMIAANKNNWPAAVSHAQAGKSFFYTIDPSAVPLAWSEGLGYTQMKQLDKALACFKEAYRLSPYSYPVISNYATVLATKQQYADAIPYYQKVLAINPKYERDYFNISFCYFSLKNYDAALEWVSKVKKDTVKRDAFIQQIKVESNQ